MDSGEKEELLLMVIFHFYKKVGRCERRNGTFRCAYQRCHEGIHYMVDDSLFIQEDPLRQSERNQHPLEAQEGPPGLTKL